MGLERHGNNLYYYRKRREGDRVVSEYMGGGELAHLWAQLDGIERESRDEERRLHKAERAEIMAGIRRSPTLTRL